MKVESCENKKYLKTTFRFEDELMRQFSKKLNRDDFVVKGSMLEIDPIFFKGKSLNGIQGVKVNIEFVLNQ